MATVPTLLGHLRWVEHGMVSENPTNSETRTQLPDSKDLPFEIKNLDFSEIQSPRERSEKSTGQKRLRGSLAIVCNRRGIRKAMPGGVLKSFPQSPFPRASRPSRSNSRASKCRSDQRLRRSNGEIPCTIALNRERLIQGRTRRETPARRADSRSLHHHRFRFAES